MNCNAERNELTIDSKVLLLGELLQVLSHVRIRLQHIVHQARDRDGHRLRTEPFNIFAELAEQDLVIVLFFKSSVTPQRLKVCVLTYTQFRINKRLNSHKHCLLTQRRLKSFLLEVNLIRRHSAR